MFFSFFFLSNLPLSAQKPHAMSLFLDDLENRQKLVRDVRPCFDHGIVAKSDENTPWVKGFGS